MAPPELEKAFNQTFRLIFGECNVRLDDLSDYLFRWHYPPHFRKSMLSGKDVIVSSDLYRSDANFISQDEIDFGKKFELDINKIKDIDSILESLIPISVYSGNKLLGKYEYVTNADTCTDVAYCYNSHNITSAKYVAYCSYVRYDSEYVFGSGWFLRSKYLIRCMGADNLVRAFETYISPNSSDLFFCYNCIGSSHLMFSFNQRSRHYRIGNNELTKEKYFSLRQKLITESREYLEKHKTFPSIFSPPSMSGPRKKELLARAPKKKKEPEDLKPVDDSFRTASRVIFGTEIGGLDENCAFLSERVVVPEKVTTFFGNENCYVPIFYYKQIPKDRMIMKEEEQLSAECKIDQSEINGLQQIVGKMGEISLYRIDMREGNVVNAIMTPIVYHGINAYYVGDLTFGKNCAFCTYGLNDEGVFGCFRTIHSKYSIRCESSYNLTACFEMDSCSNCSNSMFCHNCENLDNCMFCFNTKSKRYAIGNVEVGREAYLKIKEIVLKEILAKLKAGKKLGFDIFNLTGN